jgi:hypothetical protein
MLNLPCCAVLAAHAVVAESRVFHSHPATKGPSKSRRSVHGCGKLVVQFWLFLGREAQALLPFLRAVRQFVLALTENGKNR